MLHRPLVLALSLSLSASWSLAGCGPKDWREARSEGTSASWRAFAVAHPSEPRGAIAMRKAEALGWTEAQQANTSAAYTTFAETYPGSEHVVEARDQALALAWTEAQAADTLPALTAFVERHPTSPHKAEALVRIEQLDYEQAKLAGTLGAWGAYLAAHSDGAHAAEAQAERERLTWAATIAANTRHAYVKYLEQFPTGERADLARSWIAASHVSRLQPVVALIEAHEAVGSHATALARAKSVLDGGMFDDLRDLFTVDAARVYDGTRGMPHPHELLPPAPGVGVLVIELYEKPGEVFEPSGQGTDITAILRLYAPNTREAVWVRQATAGTPQRVTGQDVTALHNAAVRELGDRLRAFVTDLASQRPESMR